MAAIRRKAEGGRRKGAKTAHGGNSIHPSSFILHPSPRRPGLTLVELLIVITILTTLVAAAIPLMTPATAERRLREGARQLNTMINSAQARAIQLGRPVGIWLEKLSVETGREEDRGAVMNVFYCEEPEPFRGFSDGSAVCLRKLGGNQWLAHFCLNEPGSYPDDLLPPGMLRPFDRIVVEGAEFILTHTADLDSNGYYSSIAALTCKENDSKKKKWNRAFSPRWETTPTIKWTYPKSFTFRRQPQKSASDPLQLPDGVVIDLEGSGDGTNPDEGKHGGYFHDPNRPHNPNPTPTRPEKSNRNDNDSPIVIMFGPNGSLDVVYRNAGYDLPITVSRTSAPPADTGSAVTLVDGYSARGAVHLLLARRENILTSDFPDDRAKANWLDAASIWVSISPRTGRTATSENLPQVAGAFNPSSASFPNWWDTGYKELVFQRHAAREFARSNFSLGGR